MKIQLLPAIGQRPGFGEIRLELFNGRIKREALYPHAKVVNLRLPELEQADKAVWQRKGCALHLRILLGFPNNGSSQHSRVERFGPLNIGHAQGDVIERSTPKGGIAWSGLGSNVGGDAKRRERGEDALNQLLPAQRALLEKRDEILN